MSDVIKLRKNINNLTSDELKKLRSAYGKAMKLNDNRGFAHFAGFHGYPNWNCWHGPQSKDGWPGVRLFFPWHRAYLYTFERALQDLEPGVTIPWWDWRASNAAQNIVPKAFSDPTIPNATSKKIPTEIMVMFSDLLTFPTISKILEIFLVKIKKDSQKTIAKETLTRLSEGLKDPKQKETITHCSELLTDPKQKETLKQCYDILTSTKQKETLKKFSDIMSDSGKINFLAKFFDLLTTPTPEKVAAFFNSELNNSSKRAIAKDALNKFSDTVLNSISEDHLQVLAEDINQKSWKFRLKEISESEELSKLKKAFDVLKSLNLFKQIFEIFKTQKSLKDHLKALNTMTPSGGTLNAPSSTLNAPSSTLNTPSSTPNPLYSFRMKFPERNIDRDTRRFPGKTLGSPVSLPSPADIDSLLKIPDSHFDDFSDAAEDIHGLIHVWTGGEIREDNKRVSGDMGSIAFAAYDPIFWSHHCTIDRLWWMWQKKNGIDEIPKHYKKMALEPFGMTVEEVLDIYDLGYDYAGTETAVNGNWSGPSGVIQNG